MKIKFDKLEAIEGQRKDGSVWTGVKICGKKIEDGTDWKSAGIFDSDKSLSDVVEELRSTEQGTPVNVIHKQKPGTKFWDITEVQIGEGSFDTNPRTYPASGQSGAGSAKAGTTGGNSMSKEEWAAKDAKKSAEIAKSVALKAAVDYDQEGKTPEGTIKLAKIFEDYLLDKPTDDPLAPPEED
jgi:hypothetical protein